MGRASGITATADADVRSAGIGDADDVARLLTELGYPCDSDDAAERIAATLDDARQVLLLARCEDRACGLMALDFMYYLPLAAITCRITALVIAPEAQRRGLGRQLLREAERRARVACAARLELASAAHRKDAHAFYRACGYGEGAVRFVKLLGDA
ncbi:MAG: GNAT family N-acetyltransferase [Pseudomonadota bacterium]|nr:GNAT family N-acetyltransferase [Pseudomonadota bacterium]